MQVVERCILKGIFLFCSNECFSHAHFSFHMPSNTQRDVTHINMCNSQKSLQNFVDPMGLWFHLEMGESWGGMRETKASNVFLNANVLNTGFDHEDVMRRPQ